MKALQGLSKGANKAIRTLGSSNHCLEEREAHDFYATDPRALEQLLLFEQFAPDIWECACGQGHLSKVLEKRGHNVFSSDLYNYGYGETGVNFLSSNSFFHGDIITNPPYKKSLEFAKKALSIIPDGNKVALFLKLLFLESKARKRFFEKTPPKRVYVSSSRLECAKDGVFKGVSAVAYAWFIWEKGYCGAPEIHWFN